MKTLLILFTLILVSACGGKKTSTQFGINLGALLSGSTPNGGLYLMGTNGNDKFSVGLTASEASNFSLILPQGTWTFTAIAWLGNGIEPMTNKSRCAHSTGNTIQGQSATVSLNLTEASCFSPLFSSATYHDTVLVGAFKRVGLNSCLNPDGLGAGTLCDGASFNTKPGEHLSFKLSLPGMSSFGQSFSSLTSNCFNTTSINVGSTSYASRWPAGGTLKFPGEIIAYEKTDCASDSFVYKFSDGIDGSDGFDRVVNIDSTSTLRIMFADNYVGKIGSAFMNADASNHVRLPSVVCTGGGTHCLKTGTNGPYRNSEYDQVRRGVWDLFGSNDKNDPDDYIAATDATNVLVSDNTATVQVSAPGKGSLGNSMQISMVNLGPSGAVTVGCSYPLTVNFYDDSTATDIATAINSCASEILAVGNDGAGGIFSGGNYTLSGGTDSLGTNRRRKDGEIHRIVYMLIGPISSLLAKNGITTGAQLCSAQGSYNLQLPDEAVTITLGGTTASAMHPTFAANANQFEKKISIAINGVLESAYYFNCNDATGNDDHGVGAYVSYESDGSQSSIEQVFWDVTTAGSEIVESNVKYIYGTNTFWKYDLFKKNGAGDIFDYWSITGSTEYNSYQRLSGKTAAGSLYTYNLVGSGATDSTAMTVSASVDDEWSISSGGFLSSGNTQVLNPSTVQSSPNTAPSYSINDIINNSSIWNLSF
ncbi:MAG: hypothetical protein COW01_07135 [Bdellovibrionales bacterium CG12_big_fil_rev_8_21_14_0_65_38_15]|nr:MAG: hypothetical protein COW79_13815 [Bdellovibrionales bacterium CG22_combo_CG10-13_8_21_14_all_38_13]PIQ55743.1 MAG: hypothetical protein COW01_07135 [Bdellovibrionales bacterium CG12_big_fil_rev_8_21_14_0_65_38_15]PIR30753.1 MAG: hypothetical protein COV38_04445 [Bdellovibrionales bacterium CG11_big_fil_rev_8_21_14_0_20_38_13]